MNKLYEVQIVRDTDAKEAKVTVEYYLAPSMKHVILKLKLELNDQRCEVVAIKAMVPVLEVLS